MRVDTSDRRKSRIARAIAKDVKHTGYLKKGVGTGDLRRRIERTDLGNLIEFIRAVHAEMAALMDAARRGISVADTVMYVTTFPCHHCARHVVAAGIKRVVYIAPYPKSLAGGLHQDSIAVDPSHGERPDSKVTFEPFVGVGPSRYLDLFEMPPRKSRRTGKVKPFRPKKANPRLAEIEPPEMVPKLLGYIRREERALDLLVTVQDGPGRPRLGGLEFDHPAPH